MPAYMIARVKVHDPEGYEAYKTKASAAIAAHGGRYLARGGALEVLEGDDSGARLVIVEFADMDTAKAFYNSDAYQEAVKIRQPVSEGNFIVVEGL